MKKKHLHISVVSFSFTRSLHRSERRIILTWFDDLEIDVPEAAAAAEEMAGCEYIMSDLIGGKT